MTYQNYITFKSLDEARRHQRGEDIKAKPPKPPRPKLLKIKSARKGTDAEPLTLEEKQSIGQDAGTVREVAERWGVSTCTVRNYRVRYGADR